MFLEDEMKAFCSTDPALVQALDWEEARQYLLRGMFEDIGFNLHISEAEKLSLMETQFRSPDQGRGPGMKAVLSEAKLRSLLELCTDLAKGGPTRIKSSKTGEPIEGTEGRGLQQAAADIVSFVILEVPETGTAMLKLHKRVLRWWIKEANAGRTSEEQVLEILTKFKAVGVDEYPTAKTASANPEHLWFVWLFLIGQGIS